MGNKNYTKYSENSKKNANEEVVEEVVIEGVTEIPEGEEVVEEVVIEAPEEVANTLIQSLENDEVKEEEKSTLPLPEVKIVTGVVTDCAKLNVRKEANKDSEVLCVVNRNEVVNVVSNEETNNGFFKVYTTSGVEGYCMVKYISIK